MTGMNGGESTSRGGGGHQSSEVEIDCASVSEVVELASPKQTLSTVSRGDILPVELRGNSVVVTNELGQPIGAIAEEWVGQLKKCIQDGHEYEAEVRHISIPECAVHVTNA